MTIWIGHSSRSIGDVCLLTILGLMIFHYSNNLALGFTSQLHANTLPLRRSRSLSDHTLLSLSSKEDSDEKPVENGVVPKKPPMIMPINRPRSRSLGERRTNKYYGTINPSVTPLPEKRNNKRRREANRDKNRKRKRIEVERSRYSSGEESIGIVSLQDIERKAKIKRSIPDVNLSRQILSIFQSKSWKQDLEEVTKDLIQYKIRNFQQETISMSDLIIPKDQTSIIRLLGAKGCYKAMMAMLHHFLPKTDEIDSQFLYTAALTAFAQSKTPKKRENAIRILDEMDENGVRPNGYTLTAAFLSIDGGRKAMALWDRVKSYERRGDITLDVHLYNSCIHACSRYENRDTEVNGWKSAITLFRQMPRDGIEPNEQTYASLIHACANGGQMRVALSLLDEMKRNKNLTQTLPKVWGAALRACATKGDGSKAMSLMRDMVERGIEINTLHLNNVLAALSKQGRDAEARDLLLHMQNGTVILSLSDDFKNITDSYSNDDSTAMTSPDLISVNTVLTAFANNNNYDGAKDLFQRLRDGDFLSNPLDPMSKLFPDIISYNLLLSTCNNSKEAVDIVDEIRMTRRNRRNVVRATCVTYTNAISACKKSDPPDLKTALKLLSEAEKKDACNPNIFMYSAAIWVAESCNNAKTALFLLKTMRKNGCHPNAICYDGVISSLAEQGKLEAACSLFQLMKKEGIAPTVTTFQRLSLAAQNSHCSPETAIRSLESVLDVLNDFELRASISGPIYNSLIRLYGAINDFEKALYTYENVDHANAAILSSILFVCSSVKPVRWQDAIIILHTSDIVENAMGRGKIEYSALSYAIIACSKQNEWKEGLNLLNIYGTAKDNGKQVASVDAMNSLIAAAGRSGRPDMAVKLLNDCHIYSIVPNMRSYRSAIVACNQAQHEIRRQQRRKERSSGSSRMQEESQYTKVEESSDPLSLHWWEASLSLLRRMREEGLVPDAQTYSSVIAACQAAGCWQRALGVLKEMTSRDNTNPPNKFCLNAAISACEKGGAWLEALELYEKMKTTIKPDFITMNSLLIALANADQKELAENIYKEALRDRILWPWKTDGRTGDRIMDLHQFSVEMSKIAVRNVIESFLSPKPVHDVTKDLILVVGKGYGSEDGIRMLAPNVMNLLEEEYCLKAEIDPKNEGRIIVRSDELQKFSDL